jgi:Tfp pilus assembly protein PilF
MTTDRRRLTWFLVLILAVPGLASAAKVGRLIGKVVDTKGKPISGVTVTTTAPEIAGFRQVATTNDKGIFMVDFPRNEVLYRYELEKTGYTTLRLEQKWTLEGTERQEFKMEPAGGSAAAAAPLASTSNAAIQAFNDGVKAFEAKDYAAASAKLEEALKHDPNLRQAWGVLGRTQFAQGQFKEAAATAEKAVALGSTEESVLRLRWEAYRKTGDEAKAAEARKDLEKFGRLAEDAKRVFNEGVALSKAGDDQGAFAKFNEALQLDPTFQPALLGVAATGLKIGRAAEAAAAATTLLEANPVHEQALRARYNAYLKLGDEEKVADSLVGLAAADPTTARDSLYKLAEVAFESDDSAKAKKRVAKALEIDPNHARSHYLMGLILMREGAKDEAKRYLERFIALAPNDPDAATAKDALKYLK